jgi:hypothetical protein
LKDVLKEQRKLALQNLAEKGLGRLTENKSQEGKVCCRKTIKRRGHQNLNHSIPQLKRKRRKANRILDNFK